MHTNSTQLRRDFVAFLVRLCALGSLAGCSALLDTDKAQLGALPLPCETGQSASCPCPDGTTSTQTCNKLARYDHCACLNHGGGGGPAAGAAGKGAASAGNSAGQSGASGKAGAR